MNHKYIFTSLCRISDLGESEFSLLEIPKSDWANGDYVAVKVLDPGGIGLQIELPNGRMRGVIGGDLIIGALGERFATLEATGSWKKVDKDMRMHILTAAGLLGKLTSKSVFIPQIMEVIYMGHVHKNSEKCKMSDYIEVIEDIPFVTPTILFIGTSMSAGKTTSARIVTHLLKMAGLKVVGAKLTGAGRFKDILAMKDVGADYIFDFVNVGLPSSICPPNEFNNRLRQLLNHIANVECDVAVIEIGASPMEPYNGDLAIDRIRDQVKCIVLSASDPYAVYGLMKAFNIKPDIVTGKATNTLAGQLMVEKLCGVRAINMIDFNNMPEIRSVLSEATGFNI